jgi:hypothetical protein
MARAKKGPPFWAARRIQRWWRRAGQAKGDGEDFVALRDHVRANKWELMFLDTATLMGPGASDFTPIMSGSRSAFFEMVRQNLPAFVGRELVEVRVFVQPDGLSQKTEWAQWIVSVVVGVFKLDPAGNVLRYPNARALAVNFYQPELERHPFTLKDIELVILAVYQSVVSGNALAGIDFTDFVRRLRKNQKRKATRRIQRWWRRYVADMEKYLVELKEERRRNEWGAMYFKGSDVGGPADEEIQPFLKSQYPVVKRELHKIFQAKPEEFGNTAILEVRMVCCSPEKMHRKVDAGDMTPWVVSIQVSLCRTDETGKMLTVRHHIDYWALRINLTAADLRRRPFDLEFVNNLMRITLKKTVTSSAAGLSMEEFRAKIAAYKAKAKEKRRLIRAASKLLRQKCAARRIQRWWRRAGQAEGGEAKGEGGKA